MVLLIVQLVQKSLWLSLTLGSIAFGISLFAISFYSFLTIKEIQLNRRQSNFVDSVTHELKTPIAALRLYLDTLLMQEPGPEDRREFYDTMNTELQRLDHLINQLLEVGRLDAIGHQTEPEEIALEPLLHQCAEAACLHHKVNLATTFRFETAGVVLTSRRLPLEMIFRNLMDNAVKYGGSPPQVVVQAYARGRDRVVVRIQDNGEGVPPEHRRRIFQMFFRGSDELQRTRKGTGLGLYIVRTLVTILKGRVTVEPADSGSGSMFEVTLPGRGTPPGQSVVEDTGTRIRQLIFSARESDK
ncbi:MAG: HAMP domain-containing histidine kinase [Planctomycetaceae bacterium]|nr:HAMP domain-containing histidine kinase [Planctomycetaceae bacterium]